MKSRMLRKLSRHNLKQAQVYLLTGPKKWDNVG
jgi:hypothetical protein